MRVCYRAVKHNPPDLTDFESYWDQGKRPRPHTPKRELDYKSVSVHDTEEHARANALKHGLGSWLARLEIAEDSPLELDPVTNPYC
jgi:hypothetical protein